jgi:hypothetical protein
MKMLLAGAAVLTVLSASTANACAPDVCDGTYIYRRYHTRLINRFGNQEYLNSEMSWKGRGIADVTSMLMGRGGTHFHQMTQVFLHMCQ